MAWKQIMPLPRSPPWRVGAALRRSREIIVVAVVGTFLVDSMLFMWARASLEFIGLMVSVQIAVSVIGSEPERKTGVNGNTITSLESKIWSVIRTWLIVGGLTIIAASTIVVVMMASLGLQPLGHLPTFGAFMLLFGGGFLSLLLPILCFTFGLAFLRAKRAGIKLEDLVSSKE